MTKNHPFTKVNFHNGCHCTVDVRLAENQLMRNWTHLFFNDPDDYSKGFFVVDYHLAYLEKVDFDCKPGDLKREVWSNHEEIPDIFPDHVNRLWMIDQMDKSLRFAYGVWLTLSKLGLFHMDWGDNNNVGCWSACYDIAKSSDRETKELGEDLVGHTVFKVHVPCGLYRETE